MTLASSVVTPYRSLSVFTHPVVEPVSLGEAKAACRIDAGDEDAYVQSLITMSRTYVEDILDTALVNRVLEARYDSFPSWELVLPRPPMAPEVVTVMYRDEGGTMRTLTSTANEFQVDRMSIPGRIYPNYGGDWPGVRGDENSVVVRWTAGYGTSGVSAPAMEKQLILLQVAHLFEIRQPVLVGYSQVIPVPGTFETLLAASGWGRYQ